VNAIGPRQPIRRRRTLIALALLFFAPVGLAFLLYYGSSWRPGSRVNHGDLIDPAVPLPEVALPQAADTAGGAAPAAADTTSPAFLRGKWTLLYLGPGSCPDRCRADLYNTRQVRAALGADRERVQRVFIAEGACCDLEWLRTQHPDLITLRASAAAAPLIALLRAGALPAAAAADRVYLIDPLGNLMMSYALDARPKGMLEDLKKLLRLSQVG
jgi:cytochrome oxidase Cu insertion factor (SCO1/SenC/PrrC family)